MDLSKEDVKKIAELARIGVNDDECAAYQKDLSAVLDYFKKLEELDTDQVELIGHITGVTDVYRVDESVDFDAEGKETMRKNIPDEKDGYIKVQSVM